MSINRLSGYTELTLQSGQVIPLKFCNGSLHLFADLMGLSLLSDIDQALTCPEVDGKPQLSPYYMKALRLYVFSAAKYVCLTENRPVTFNEWIVSEWIEEVGTDRILQALELPEKTDLADDSQNVTDADGPKTIQAYKFDVMARLQLLPDRYYDLTPGETAALVKGESDREVFALFNTRIVASLLRNAHFEKPLPAEKYMPLPIDKQIKKKVDYLPPTVMLELMAHTFGLEINRKQPSA